MNYLSLVYRFPVTIALGGSSAVGIIAADATPNIFSGSADDLDFANGRLGSSSSYASTTINSKSSHGFAPYVPPFLDPNSNPYVEITFNAGESKKYSAQEIIEASTYEYYNFNEVPNNSSTNTNYKESMSLSASLNLGICASLRTDNIQTIIEGERFIGSLASDSITPLGISARTEFRVSPDKRLDRWIIQSKWETPVLNFKDVKVTGLSTDGVQMSGS